MGFGIVCIVYCVGSVVFYSVRETCKLGLICIEVRDKASKNSRLDVSRSGFVSLINRCQMFMIAASY